MRMKMVALGIETIEAAKRFNRELSLKYALEHGCPVGEKNN
jgi:hypothetical protein